jgi:hypothetical protein
MLNCEFLEAAALAFLETTSPHAAIRPSTLFTYVLNRGSATSIFNHLSADFADLEAPAKSAPPAIKI